MEKKKSRTRPLPHGAKASLHRLQPKGESRLSIEEFRQKIESDPKLRKHVHFIDIRPLLSGKTGTDAAETLAKAIHDELESMKKDDMR